MGQVVLVERVGGRYQQRQRTPARPSGPTGAGPLRHLRAGVADHDDGIDAAYVHAEFERAGGRKDGDVTVLEAGFEQAPVRRRVAGAVALNRRRQLGREVAGGVAPYEFGTLARVTEEDRLHAAAGELGG